MQDAIHRTIDYIRISVTDRCNLRCIYCMPASHNQFIPHNEILSFDEIYRIVVILAKMGLKKIKITGGEPMLRKDICHLIKQLKSIPGIQSLTLTTNGICTKPYLNELKHIGIDGINFSLDTMNPDTFKTITGYDGLSVVLDSIFTALELQMPNIKINCVAFSESNKTDILKLASLAKEKPISIRFIEMMPIGLGKDFSVLHEDDILELLSHYYGKPKSYSKSLGNGPAHYYHFDHFTGYIGFISAMTHQFCDNCNRIRLTASGKLKTCLFYDHGINLRNLLRSQQSDYIIEKAIEDIIFHKPAHHNLNNLIEEHGKMSDIGG